MGIPAFFAHLLRTYPRIQRPSLPAGLPSPDYLFMDCNSVIYDAFRDMDNESPAEQVAQKVVAEIEKIILTVRPQQFTYVAFDGVAPLAKIKQQRERRFKCAAAAAATAATAVPATTNNKPNFVPESFLIIPGTEFMTTLCAHVQQHFQHTNVIVSGADESGEGEQKIFQYIRRNNIDACAAKTAVIFGMDADLFMLCLLHMQRFKQLYVMRPDNGTGSGGGSSSSSGSSIHMFVDIRYLRQCIASAMGGSTAAGEQESDAAARQYIIMCFLLGNDFLPKINSLDLRGGSGMRALLRHGRRRNPWSVQSEIHWRNMGAFLHDLARDEERLISELFLDRNKFEKRLRANAAVAIKDDFAPMFHREAEKYICPPDDGWRVRYYRVCFDGLDVTTNSGAAQLRSICRNYIAGLEWTWKYYTCDACPDPLWTYKHSFAPLLCDIVRFVPTHKYSFFNNESSSTSPPPPPIISAAVQLVLALPPDVYATNHVLPLHLQQIQRAFRASLAPAADVREYRQMHIFAKYEYESHLCIPVVDHTLVAAISREISS